MGVGIVFIPPFSAGGLRLQPNFQKKKGGGGSGLTEPQLLEGVAGNEGGDFFQGQGSNSHIKINSNLKYLMTKKVYKQNS